MADPAKTFDAGVQEKPITRRTRRQSQRYQVQEQDRRVKTYPLSKLELLTLSALNPVAAALIGWGINVATTWANMPHEDKSRTMMGIAATMLIGFGSLLQLIAWAMLAVVWFECRSQSKD